MHSPSYIFVKEAPTVCIVRIFAQLGSISRTKLMNINVTFYRNNYFNTDKIYEF